MSGTSWMLLKLAYLSGWRLMTPTEISEPSRNVEGTETDLLAGLNLGFYPERVLKVYENAKVQRTCHELQWYIVIWTVFIASAASHSCLWHGSSLGTALGQSVFDDASNMSNAFLMVWFGNRMYCWRIDENRLAPTSSQTHGEKTVERQNPLKGFERPLLAFHSRPLPSRDRWAGAASEISSSFCRCGSKCSQKYRKDNFAKCWKEFQEKQFRAVVKILDILEIGSRASGYPGTGGLGSATLVGSCQLDSSGVNLIQFTLYIYISAIESRASEMVAHGSQCLV